MLLNPPIDKLLEKYNSPYELAVLVGKRAKNLAQNLTEEQKEEKKEVSRALLEAYNGEIANQ